MSDCAASAERARMPNHYPAPLLPQSQQYLVLETHSPDRCLSCDAEIVLLEGCRAVVFLDIRGRPLVARLICPLC